MVLNMAEEPTEVSGLQGTVAICTDRTRDTESISGTSLLLANNRFKVDVTWHTTDGKSGSGTPVALTSDTGYFWFFQSSNVEMVIKVLNACSLNSHYWVFAGGLTNVRTVIKVTDTLTGKFKSYVNLQGVNPLVGPNDERFGLRFPDMTQAYDREFQRFVTEEGKKLAQNIHNGVYLAVQGPSYETPAEIYSFRTIGADLVGMSTVPEVIAARHSAIRVLGISCVTNMAAGTTDAPLNQEEVLEIAARIKPQFISLLRAVIPRISEAIA